MADYKHIPEEEVRDILMNAEYGTPKETMETHLAEIERQRGQEALNMSVDLTQPGAAPHKDSGYGPSHTVVEGDSLSRLAELYGTHYGTVVTADAIAAANKIKDPNTIQMGAVLDMSKFIKK